MKAKVTIGLDYSHNNILTLESSSFSEFTQFIFRSGYKIGKLEIGFDNIDNLKDYNAVIISTPKNVLLTPKEIESMETYVKMGGSLLVVSSSGGDYSNNTNLNELTRKFGFEFESDEINDSVNFVNMQKRPIITRFKPHLITEQLKKNVFSSSCSIKILDFVNEDKNVNVEGILKAGLNCWRKRFNGEDWIEEDSPKIPLLVVAEYYKGKVIGLGNISIFSSLAHEYGFSALDNDILIANILTWLIEDIESKGKVLSFELNLDLYYWLEKIIKKEKWEDVSDLINVSLKYFKDNYEEIIESIKKLRLERLEKKKIYEIAKKKAEETEAEILEKVPVNERKKEDLVDIMSALEEITGEKYEYSIDFEEEESMDEEEDEDDSEEERLSLNYSDEDIEDFEKDNSKKAIWHGKPTKSFKEWLKKKSER